MRILVADDDRAMARLMSTWLAQSKHDVRVVHDGDHALREVMTGDYDALVIDWMMPRVDGLTAVRDARDGLARPPAVVVVSALRGGAARDHALAVGADEFVAKPFTQASLEGALSRALSKHGPATRLPTTERACRLVTCAGWPLAVDAAACAVADATDAPFHTRPGGEGDPEVVRATLGMVDVVNRAEVHVALLASADDGRALSRWMLKVEDPDDLLVHELLTELCNTVLGRLKTLFRSDGFGFTLGVADPDAAPGFVGSRTRKRALAERGRDAWCARFQHLLAQPLAWEGASGFDAGPSEQERIGLTVLIGLRAAGVAEVPACDLSESMVLVDDVRSPGGALLLPRGTRLTSGMTEQLRSLGASSLLRVVKRVAA